MPDGPISEDEPSTVGWNAITALLERLYPGQEPRHWAPVPHFRLGGPSPLDGISAYLHVNEPDHWHFVSYGMSELYAKEWDDKQTSGWGCEFTFRLKRGAGEAEPPQWPLSLLQNLARYVFSSGNVFAAGHYLPLNGPIALEKTTTIWAAMFVEDPELEELHTPNGSLQFLQLVGLTLDELAAVRAWNGEKFAELLREDNSLLVTDLARQSVLLNPAIARAVEQGIAQHGSSSSSLAVRELNFSDTLAGVHTIIVGASGVGDLKALLRGRILFGRSFALIGPKVSVVFEPSERFEWKRESESEIKVSLSAAMAEALAGALQPKRGQYPVPSVPNLAIHVVPTQVMDPTGKKVVEVIG